MSVTKKLLLLFFLCVLFSVVKAQNLNWMLGNWNGTGNTQVISKSKFTRSITINSVSGESFTGTKTNEINDHNHAKIVTSISGYFDKDQFYFKNGVVLYKKEPSNGQWWDCSSCTPQNKITIKQDSIILTIRISGCQKDCDGMAVYYRLLCEYDTATQRSLVNLFGKSSDIASFRPCIKEQTEIIASDPDGIMLNTDSLKNVTKIENKQDQQRIQDSLRNVAAIANKRKQEMDDSIKTAVFLVKKRKQEIADSLNAASIAEKKRQQQVNDSLKIIKQQAQQRMQDSLKTATAIEKKRKQEIEDSARNAAVLAKKRQQAVDASLSAEAALAKKRQQQVADSINIVNQKEQQKLEDSLKTAAAIDKKRKQAIEDSIKNAAILADKKRQAVADSLNTAFIAAKKREKQIADSLSIVKKKEQQKIQDSIKTAAVIDKKRRQAIDDSTKNAVILAKKKQQAVDDSLRIVTAAEKKQHLEDSLKNLAVVAAKNPPSVKDTARASTTKALQQRDNVLLETYHITTPDILIELFDNAQVDGDKVSVYHNNALIVNNQMLQKEPITFKVHANTTNRMHEFIMIAENLGTIPPNTALMRITVGTQVYKLSVKTDLKTNAKIIFYYDGN